jgi:hypothetical protein
VFSSSLWLATSEYRGVSWRYEIKSLSKIFHHFFGAKKPNSTPPNIYLMKELDTDKYKIIF